MRGTPPSAIASAISLGIIPAYAGNTASMSWRSERAWDHPRVCGEHNMLPSVVAVPEGSSPRMRGTLRPVASCTPSARIIPAYAGNTVPLRDLHPHVGDHPRVCGEHHPIRVGYHDALGSSPRMRGTRRTQCGSSCCRGIIPAYAGNTGRSTASNPS